MRESNSQLPVLNFSSYELDRHGDNTVNHMIFTAHGKLSFLSQLIKCSIRHTDQYSIVNEGTCGTQGPPYYAGILQQPRRV